MTPTRPMPRRRLLVLISEGRRRVRILNDLENGVFIIRAVGAPGFSVTHGPTGFAFFSQIKSRSIAAKVARVTAGIADWSKARTVPQVKTLYDRLPSELREWFPLANRQFSIETVSAAKRRRP